MEDSNGSQASTTADVSALTAVVQALKALPRDSHRRVIDAALVLLGNPPKGIEGTVPSPTGLEDFPTDVRRLTELKQPKSVSEMAAVVAYYLAEAARPAERKELFENADMVKYFKQAKFRLPSNPAMILVNAKNAGYFDSTGAGQYRLNPVGYNLVVHSLPRPASAISAPKNRNRSRRNARKTGRKS
jgi:hypothetical protein